MTITEKLSTFYAKCTQAGYIPSTIGVSDEEYKEYKQSLKKIAELCELDWCEDILVLRYKGIELKKYGKKHTDSKLAS